MRYLRFILAVLPIAAQAICKDGPPCTPPEPADPPVSACDPADRCGTACCNSVPFFRFHCANSAKSLCCLEGEVEVGNTGKCCPRGFILLGGTKCCPTRSILCGGECCVGTCDLTSRKCQSTITDQECQALGWVGACATTPRSSLCSACTPLGCCTEYIH